MATMQLELPQSPGIAAPRSSPKKLQPLLTIHTNEPSEFFSLRWDPSGQFIATGSGDGSVKVFDSDTGDIAFYLERGGEGALPATAICFRPSNKQMRTKNILIAANAVGHLQRWHVTSSKCLHAAEEPNQINCLDYRPDGMTLATAGRDCIIRLYDEATKSLTTQMSGGRGSFYQGHSNQIFAIKYHPTDENLIVTGGWDNTVIFWDARVKHSVRSFFGPHLCGDSLDISEDGSTILTGSWRPKDALEMWDFGSGRLIETVYWRQSLLTSRPCLLYSAKFSRGSRSSGRFVAAGGCGSNEARVFDRGSGSGREAVLMGTVAGLPRGVLTLDWSPTHDRVAIGAGDGSIRILEVMDREPKDQGLEVLDCTSNATKLPTVGRRSPKKATSELNQKVALPALNLN